MLTTIFLAAVAFSVILGTVNAAMSTAQDDE